MWKEKLGSLPEDVELTRRAAGTCDCVLVFAKNTAELNQLAPKALRAVKPDGLLWMAYPKQSAKVETDITRDRGWDVIRAAGLRP